ncbi:MAG: CvpA family protein [Patescibacteria group bacterium]|nr:CvpA family protein [Patescibacteria group bacterium]MDD5716134.1 CvpA family protein [Patescibacteria group bacterium]
MPMFDLILLVIFFGFVGAGFYFGLVHTLGAILGAIAGVYIAGSLYQQVADFFQFLMLKESVANVFAFVLVFLVASRGIGYMIHALDKAFKIARIIPFATLANRLGGALLGFVEATLVLGTILYVAKHFYLSEALNAAIDNSAFAGLLVSISGFLVPLIPDSIKSSVPTIPLELE